MRLQPQYCPIWIWQSMTSHPSLSSQMKSSHIWNTNIDFIQVIQFSFCVSTLTTYLGSELIFISCHTDRPKGIVPAGVAYIMTSYSTDRSPHRGAALTTRPVLSLANSSTSQSSTTDTQQKTWIIGNTLGPLYVYFLESRRSVLCYKCEDSPISNISVPESGRYSLVAYSVRNG